MTDEKDIILIVVVALFGVVLIAGLGIGYINSNTILADGTNPLTGNWNAGDFNITADYFFGIFDGSISEAINADALDY